MNICDDPETSPLALISLSIVVLIDAVNVLRLAVVASKATNTAFCELSIAAIEPLNEPIEELRLLVVVATDELNEPIEELRLLVVVATDPDKEPILVETEELKFNVVVATELDKFPIVVLNAPLILFKLELKPNVVVATELDSDPIDVDTELDKLLIAVLTDELNADTELLIEELIELLNEV